MKKWIGCLAILGWLGTAAMADEKPGTSPARVAAGKKVVANLKLLAPGQNRAYYFEIMHGPKETIGYAAVTLTATGSAGNVVYEYTNIGAILFPTGDKLISDITGRLRPNFEPIEIDVWNARVTPDGQMFDGENTAVVSKEKTVLTSGGGGERVSRDVPRPEEPFIYAIVSFAAQHVPTPGERFVIREFDARSGGARDLLVNTDVWEDGTATVITTTRDGDTSYQFWYNEADVLIRWTEATVPAMFVRVYKSRLEELKTRFGDVKRPAAATKQGASDKPKP